MTTNLLQYHYFHAAKLKPQVTEKEKLLAEIRYLKGRLETIGYTGDCAYEKKLSGFYLNTISCCQQKLLQF